MGSKLYANTGLRACPGCGYRYDSREHFLIHGRRERPGVRVPRVVVGGLVYDADKVPGAICDASVAPPVATDATVATSCECGWSVPEGSKNPGAARRQHRLKAKVHRANE